MGVSEDRDFVGLPGRALGFSGDVFGGAVQAGVRFDEFTHAAHAAGVDVFPPAGLVVAPDYFGPADPASAGVLPVVGLIVRGGGGRVRRGNGGGYRRGGWFEVGGPGLTHGGKISA